MSADKSESARLAKVRAQVLQHAADLRSPRQVSGKLFAGLPRRACPHEYRLSRVLTRDEQEFWHAFLANADVFASIDGNTGERFAGQATGMGWADICFDTADSVFDLLTQTRTDDIVLYDAKMHPDAWSRLLDALFDRSAVLLFELDGPMEGHKFIVYPTRDKQALLAQSVGGIMRANVRLFPAAKLFRLLTDLVRRADAKALFGYAIDNNAPQRLAFCFGSRVPDVNADLLLQKIDGLSQDDRQRMRATFKDHFDWDRFDPNKPVDSYFQMDSANTDSFFYYVDPLTFEWQCVDRAIDVPQSELSIALQSGAVCPRKYIATGN